ncbi:MAG: PKD domain-containing protein [bacterium]|nr:PKD domain-containing protein [bacterium]
MANFNFSQPGNACAVKTITLTDQSTSVSPLVNWIWVYGDGNVNSFTSNPNHTYGYSAVGNWSVTLQIFDAFGCSDQVAKGTVNVISSPTAAISANPPILVGCTSTFGAVFSASNSLGAGLSYNWNFGNGQTSTQQTAGPITFSTQAAQYVVSLTVTSSGCSAVTSTYVTVSPASLNVILPASVCLNASAIATITCNQPSSLLNMGNSVILSINTPAPSNPTISIPAYSTVGIQTITIGAGSPPCVATPITKTVSVQQVIADFAGVTPTVSCASPFGVTYTSTSSSNATQFQWSFQISSSVAITGTGSPVQFTLTQGSMNQYAIFNRPFTPTITLVARSAAGCMATASKTVHSIERPSAWFNTNKKEGCVPLTVTFYDSSIVFPSCPLINYTWCNGASPPVFVTGSVPLPPSASSVIPWQNFVYNVTGTYTPYLIITTASNYTNTVNTCTDVSFLDRIIVANPPVVSFNVLPGPYCPDQAVQIVNTTPNMNSVQHWHAQSDYGYFSGCISDPNPSGKFTHVGSFNFTLTGYQNSCAGSAVAGPVVIKGPIAKARYETNCTSRSSVSFTAELQEVATATLAYGDGSSQTLTGITTPGGTVSVTSNHVYLSSGNYIATLTAVNPLTGCSPSTFTMLVIVRNIQANFIMSPTVCAGANTTFSAFPSIDVDSGNGRGYLWYVDALPPKEFQTSAYTTSFTSNGFHTIKLFVKDANGCTDSLVQSIRVSSVTAAFALNSNTVCLSTGSIQILNSTLPTPDPIANFFWNFGDGQILNTTVTAGPLHSYTFANAPSTSYSISLLATNALGCQASIGLSVLVTKPFVSFSASKPNFCVSLAGPTTVSFTPLYSYPSYTLNFGTVPPSDTIASGVSTYSYSAPGVYNLSVTVKDLKGCLNTGTFSIVGVQTPTADFIFSSPNSTGGNNICSPNVVTFTNVAIPQQYTPTWNLGTGVLIGNTSNIVALPFSASVNSVVAISLTVNTGAPAFCVANISKSFTVYAYQADFVMTKSIVCLGETMTFSLTPTTNGLGAWVWSFGDATSSPTLFANASPPAPLVISHTYNTYNSLSAGVTSVSLIFWSGNLACNNGIDKLIKVIKVDPDFKRNLELTALDSAHCVNVLDKFINLSTSNSSQLTYTWNLGNGQKTDSVNYYYMYPRDGIYKVTLNVKDENSCLVSASKNMTLFPLPTATILPNSTGYCPNAPFELVMAASEGVNSGTWSPATHIQGSAQFTTSTNTYTSYGLVNATSGYSLTVTNTNACVSWPVDTTVFIVQPPKPVYWDTVVVIGEKVPIQVTMDKNVTYTWTPVVADLSCIQCLNPISSSTVDVVYNLVMEDRLRCSKVISSYSIGILPKSSVDLPTAFTPNGDGTNDVIYAAGWGIRKLIYLRIYNRWGQLLFESNDIKTGWDGTYNGVAQNMDTYVYQVSIETYIDDAPLTKSSTFKLVR